MRWIAMFAAIFIGGAVAEDAAAKRIALVIGNDDYENLAVLKKAVNDARAMTRTLTELGFEVVSGENLTRRETNRKLAEFEGRLQPGDEAFFYFSGHGVAVGGENYLIPRDMPEPLTGEEGLVEDEAHAVSALVERVQRKGASTAFFVLDACRDNPFASKGVRNIGRTRGLTRLEPPQGVFLLYSAGYGQAALDRLSDGDPNPNSVFTRKLLPVLKTPGLSHVDIAKRVQSDVSDLAGTVQHRQQPAYYDQIIGEIVLLPSGDGGTGGTSGGGGATVDPTPPPPAVNAAAEAWSAIQSTESAAILRAFIDEFPDTVYATFARVRLDEILEQEVEVEPPRPPPETTFLALYQDVDLYGGDVGSFRTGDATVCAQRCADELACSAFTYVEGESTCRMKGGFEFATEFTGALSGRYFRAASSSDAPTLAVEWEIHRKRDFIGNDFTELRANNFDACLRACESRSACQGFSWAPNITRNNNCWLKTFVGEAVSTDLARRANVHVGKKLDRVVSAVGVVESE